MAPGPGETLAAERLHEDGGTARAGRADDRAPAAAGADEIGNWFAEPRDRQPKSTLSRPTANSGQLKHLFRTASGQQAIWLVP
jgi:hypothetical protein